MALPTLQPTHSPRSREPSRSNVQPAAAGRDGTAPLVFVIDDDLSVRTALGRLLRSVDMQVELFGTAPEFLKRRQQVRPNCLVLDIRLPGMNGLDLQGQLADSNIRTPIVFMTGHGDVPMSVRAMKAGAIDFLAKPFREQDMLDAVAAAVDFDRQARQTEDAESGLRAAYELLSPREREVMTLVTSGLLNKQVAGRLGLSLITVKVHRRNAMQKVGAKSLAELVRMAESLEIHKAVPVRLDAT